MSNLIRCPDGRPHDDEWTPERLERALVLAHEFIELTIEDVTLCRRHHVAPHAGTLLGLRNVAAALESASRAVSDLFGIEMFDAIDRSEAAA